MNKNNLIKMLISDDPEAIILAISIYQNSLELDDLDKADIRRNLGVTYWYLWKPTFERGYFLRRWYNVGGYFYL